MNSDERNDNWVAFNERHRLGTAHQTVLSYLHFEGARPYDEAASRSRGWASHTGKPIQATKEYRDAISDMESRNLLWNIDKEKLSAIRDFISDPKAIGPIEIMPPIRTLQFSVNLVTMLDEYWAKSEIERSGCIYSPHYLPDGSINVYSLKHENCLNFIHDSGMLSPTAKQQSWHPEPCGAWRDQWWCFYERGFVLAIPPDCVIGE